MDGIARGAKIRSIEIVASDTSESVCLVNTGSPSSIVSSTESACVADRKISIDAG